MAAAVGSLMMRSPTRQPIKRSLNDAGVRLSDIDKVVLVGGATKMPMIRHFVAKLFRRLPDASVDRLLVLLILVMKAKRADIGLRKGQFAFLRDGGGPGGPGFLHGLGRLLHLRRRGAGADGVGKDVHLREAAGANELQRGGELLLRLTGETGNEVRGDGGLSEGLRGTGLRRPL